MFPHLLIAIDRRATTRRDIALGFRVASSIGARVTVLFVVTPAQGDAQPARGPRSQDAIEEGERLFRRVRRLAKALGVPCVCRFAFGSDAEMIVSEAAAAHHCDLVLFSAPEAAVRETDAAVPG